MNVLGAAIQHPGRFFKRGRSQNMNFSLARQIGGDLEEIHAPARKDSYRGELRTQWARIAPALEFNYPLPANFHIGCGSCISVGGGRLRLGTNEDSTGQSMSG